MNWFVGIVITIAVFLFGGTFLGSWYTVDQRERCIVLTNGAFSSVAEPGWHGKMPWFQSVKCISLETNIVKVPEVDSYSYDQQPAKMSISVNYHVTPDKVQEIYTRFGSLSEFESRIIKPRIMNEFKNVFGKFTAAKAIQERSTLSAQVDVSITNALKNEPAILDSVQVENVDFSDSYEKSVEERMLAEVEVQKMKQNAEREIVQAQIKVTQATANAQSVKLAGEAEAYAIKARADALSTNPSLVQLTQAEKWNGVLPTTMVPNGSVPMLTLGK